MNPRETLLAKLLGVRRTGAGWAARCPAHEDRKASLSISEGDDSRVLVKCHAGCETTAILAAIGMTLADLFPLKPAPSPSRNGNRKASEKAYATARDAVAALERRLGNRSALWTYHNAQGEPAGVVVRWDNPNGKEIRPVSHYADGWRIGAMPEPRPLYRLPELKAAKIIVVCEGEKAADAVRSLGFIVTTSAGGAKAAHKTDWGTLAGKEVWTMGDHDAAGESYADAVAQLTVAAGAACVRGFRLADHAPQLPEGGDIADVLSDEHWCGLPLGDSAELADVAAFIEEKAKAVEPWQPRKNETTGPVLTCLADVEPRPVSWLWPSRIPLGRITLLVGRPGEGKSFVTIDAASRVSTGTAWPDGRNCPRGSVIIISAEDDPADTIRPRLDAHCADVSKVHLLSAVRRVDNKGPHERMITLADIDEIGESLKRLPDCKLIIVDPVGSFLGGQTDAHRDNEVRSVLAPLARLAEKHGVAVFVVAHRRKGAGAFADDLALGSRAFTGIARAVWHLSRETENSARRLFLPGKNNLAAEGDGLAFTIIGNPARISWEPDPVAMNADDALAFENKGRRTKPGPEAEAQEEATGWLQSALANGPRLAKELSEEWKHAEGGSQRTLERAKKSLHIVASRSKIPGPWSWRLPQQDATSPKEAELGDLGILAKNPGVMDNYESVERKTAKIPVIGVLGNLHDNCPLPPSENSNGPYDQRF